MPDVRHIGERGRAAPRVLLLEDEPRARDAIAQALDGAGLGVAGATASAEAALRAAAAADPAGPPPAALVTDTDLAPGGMDGLALAAEARRRWPGLGVVYVTGRPSKLHVHVLRGRDRFLPKPVMPGAVVRAVRGLVGAASGRAP
jgi:two-component system, OmpR family, response regulator